MSRPESIRSILLGKGALSIYLPSFLISTGEGAILPTLPVTATGMGASLALAGLVAGLIMIGEVVGDIPSGWVVSRIGENRAMLVGAGVIAAATLLCLTAPSLLVFAAGVFLMGFATAVFALARHALLTSTIPITIRARALSLLGGTFRAGYFIGPFLAAAIIPFAGTQAVFAIPLVLCALTVIALVVLPDPAALLSQTRVDPSQIEPVRPQQDAGARGGLFPTLLAFRSVLARMGTGALIVGLLRSSRQAILPLWAVHLSMDPSHIALVIGVAGAVDFALFYSSGQIMDRFGRAWSAVPSLLGLGVCHLLLPIGTGIAGFAAIAIAMSVANGIGSGILMTIGADLAPRADPAPFLGAWRFFGDTGNAAAPFVISALTAVSGLALPAIVIGALGLAGAGMMARFIPRYLDRT